MQAKAQPGPRLFLCSLSATFSATWKSALNSRHRQSSIPNENRIKNNYVSFSLKCTRPTCSPPVFTLFIYNLFGCLTLIDCPSNTQTQFYLYPTDRLSCNVFECAFTIYLSAIRLFHDISFPISAFILPEVNDILYAFCRLGLGALAHSHTPPDGSLCSTRLGRLPVRVIESHSEILLHVYHIQHSHRRLIK